jgi:iron complex transport system ATP-binding protein
MVELRGVSYQAGGTTILDDVSVRFRPGRFNVIVGPNGAGKSTLMRLASGLVRPTTGEVRYEDRPLASLPSDALARTRAVLSQHVELAFPLPVADVVLMGRYPHYGRVPSARDREIVQRALELVGMSHKQEQPYPTLSGGEQQKVQLARVLAQIWNFDAPPGAAREHRYLFLDEPTSSLDVHYQLHLLDVARELLAHDCTVVAILHDLNVAFSYGGHFVLLEEGRVAAEAERAQDIPVEMLERLFRVRVRKISDPQDDATFWRFGL